MYDLDFAKKAKMLLHIRKFFLFPDNWDPTNSLPDLNVKWHSCKFTPENRNKVPKKKGVYCFVVIPDYKHLFVTKYLFYVGKTNRTLWVRYKEYLDDQLAKGKPRSKIYEMLTLYKDHLHFFYSTIDESKTIDLFEEELLNVFVPHINSEIPDAKFKPELKNIYEG